MFGRQAGSVVAQPRNKANHKRESELLARRPISFSTFTHPVFPARLRRVPYSYVPGSVSSFNTSKIPYTLHIATHFPPIHHQPTHINFRSAISTQLPFNKKKNSNSHLFLRRQNLNRRCERKQHQKNHQDNTLYAIIIERFFFFLQNRCAKSER